MIEERERMKGAETKLSLLKEQYTLKNLVFYDLINIIAVFNLKKVRGREERT